MRSKLSAAPVAAFAEAVAAEHTAPLSWSLVINLPIAQQVKKVTSRGGGAALPLRPRLFRRLVAAAASGVGGAAALTVKLRIGLARRPEEMTYFLEVGGETGARQMFSHCMASQHIRHSS
jgi:hypothetical protein